MGIVIGPIEFEGPYSDPNNLRAEPGIYAILAETKGELELVELDEASSIKNCLDCDEYTSNMRFWLETSSTGLMAAVHYTPNMSRVERRGIKMRLLQEFE